MYTVIVEEEGSYFGKYNICFFKGVKPILVDTVEEAEQHRDRMQKAVLSNPEKIVYRVYELKEVV